MGWLPEWQNSSLTMGSEANPTKKIQGRFNHSLLTEQYVLDTNAGKQLS